MKNFATRTEHFKNSIFGKMTSLAQKYNAVNLAQGFPDLELPEFVEENLIKAMKSSSHQYAPFMGLEKLRSEIANLYQTIYGANYSLEKEITITNGATQAISLAIMALVNPGDEVIIFSPFYDSYAASIVFNGGVVKEVPLTGPDFLYDYDKLKSTFNDKTKLVIVNSPHNPTGKIFSEIEMKEISNLVSDYGCYLLSDEVYEFLTFNDNKHRSFSQIERIKDQCLVVSSMGKTFGATGHKIGYVCANAEVSEKIRFILQYSVFSVCTPMQLAYSEILKSLETHLPSFQATYENKSNEFYEGLVSIGLRPLKPQGTYFMLCHINDIPGKPKDLNNNDDVGSWLVEKFRVAVVPLSSFYLEQNLEAKSYIRFCFAKKSSTLQSALDNLSELRKFK